MDNGVTCQHLNKLTDHLGKDLWTSKDVLSCFDCGCPGPNLWICLQPECHHIGCSEVKNDHSTIHQKNYPSHCVHMNVSTERIWCYICEKEVHARAALAHQTTSPDSTSVEGSLAGRRLGSALGSSADDSDPDDMEYDDDRPKGLVGLQNMGNTCYMNAALQALSNTVPLTSYFLECGAAVAVLAGDKKPGLSRAYQKLIKEMWSRKSRGYVVPNGILYGIRNVYPMFRGYHQHDTQEFLRCFLDQLHEELKEPVWDSCLSPLECEAERDRPTEVPAPPAPRRRAASSGASDARAHSPHAHAHDRNDIRVSVADSTTRHRRSASFAGTQHAAYTALPHNLFNGPDQSQREVGSESELSCSSEAEERYETCSSGASDAADPAADTQPVMFPCGGGDGSGAGAGTGARYRSVISDVFDGRLLSAVQCLVCDRVSTRVETFQDLSLPIPSREHLAVLRCQQPAVTHPQPVAHDSWIWWVLSWLRSWLYGPAVSLQDCLAAFFSADELKGDNMYSCSRCNKLRNGVKMSGVVQLPEVLCVHLKRFRHELMFSAKVAARVSFPVRRLDMRPYTTTECVSKVSQYELCAVICHCGTAGGGHYTCLARNPRGWYCFDDQAVQPVQPAQLADTEAYVLFYRKVNPQMATLRAKAAELLDSASLEPNDIKFYLSKQWINKFNTWAEPGPIDNSDFVCAHGGVRPDRAGHLPALAAQVPQPLWEFLHTQFGGGPAVSHAHGCGQCTRAAMRLHSRQQHERAAFQRLHQLFQEEDRPRAVFAISMHWFRQWQAFVRNHTPHAPPPVDNTAILTKQEIDGVTHCALKPGSDHAQLSEELWRFFTEIYGGGPEVRLKSPQAHRDPPARDVRRLAREYSESDKEEYCSKSTSDTNIRDAIQGELQKNQSLQNIHRGVRRHKTTRSADSDEEVAYRHTFRHKIETNGNHDSDEDMDPPYGNTVRMENGVDSSDHDANDNLLVDRVADSDLPNIDSISLKNKSTKGGKVRKVKRRTVK